MTGGTNRPGIDIFMFITFVVIESRKAFECTSLVLSCNIFLCHFFLSTLNVETGAINLDKKQTAFVRPRFLLISRNKIFIHALKKKEKKKERKLRGN